MGHGYSTSAVLRSVAILGIVVLSLIVFLTFGVIFWGPGNAELKANRAKWDKSKPEAYSYIVRPVCFCGFERSVSYTVTVRSGKVTAIIEDIYGPEHAGYRLKDSTILTIDRLFDLAATSRARADRVSVTFDEARGFPSHIFIDQSRDIIDEEYRVSIEDFRIL